MISSLTSRQMRSNLIWPVLGLAYFITFFTGHALGLLAALFLLFNIRKRPAIYDIIPLFFVVDILPANGGFLFEIPLFSTIVFNIYVAKIVVFALKYGRPKALATLLLGLFIVVSAWQGLGTSSAFSSVAAFQDLKSILAITFALGLFRPIPARIFTVDHASLKHIALFFVGVTTSVFLYILVFDFAIFYVILDTTKSLLGFSLFWAAVYSNAFVIAIIAALNFFVLIFMSTRMNFLIVTTLFIILALRRAPILAMLVTVVGIIVVVWAADFSPQANRIATIFNVFAEPSMPSLGPVLSRLAELDYIRSVEAHYTFQRATIAELIFGRGLGAGFQDTDGYITASYIGGHAYSLEEFRSGTFFSLHDPIVEWTFRYGLIVSTALCGGLLLLIYRGFKNRDVLQIAIALMILTSYWSGKGVAMIALLGFLVQFSNRPRLANRPGFSGGQLV